MIPDTPSVIHAIRETAAIEIMPRFRSLSEMDIMEKNPGDLVTTSDIESEKRLGHMLGKLAPECAIIGEEAADEAPERLRALNEAAPVWVIDPLDGTRNYARGIPCFAVIVAYCLGGKTRAGWIYDPITDVTVWALEGEGAWMAEGSETDARQRLKTTQNVEMASMIGSFSVRTGKKFDSNPNDAPQTLRYGSTGREYMDLAIGKLHFAHYAKRLKPWDHAAGILVHRESGGFSALCADGLAYSPGLEIIRKDILMAPNKDCWETVNALISK